jgi:hypothetical protein
MGKHIGRDAMGAARPASLWTPWGEQAVPAKGAKFAALRKLAKRIGQLRENEKVSSPRHRSPVKS